MKDRRIGGAGDGQDPDLCRRVMQLEEAICGYERRSTFFELLIKSLPGLFYAFDDKFELHM